MGRLARRRYQLESILRSPNDAGRQGFGQRLGGRRSDRSGGARGNRPTPAFGRWARSTPAWVLRAHRSGRSPPRDRLHSRGDLVPSRSVRSTGTLVKSGARAAVVSSFTVIKGAMID